MPGDAGQHEQLLADYQAICRDFYRTADPVAGAVIHAIDAGSHEGQQEDSSHQRSGCSSRDAAAASARLDRLLGGRRLDDLPVTVRQELRATKDAARAAFHLQNSAEQERALQVRAGCRLLTDRQRHHSAAAAARQQRSRRADIASPGVVYAQAAIETAHERTALLSGLGGGRGDGPGGGGGGSSATLLGGGGQSGGFRPDPRHLRQFVAAHRAHVGTHPFLAGLAESLRCQVYQHGRYRHRSRRRRRRRCCLPACLPACCHPTVPTASPRPGVVRWGVKIYRMGGLANTHGLHVAGVCERTDGRHGGRTSVSSQVGCGFCVIWCFEDELLTQSGGAGFATGAIALLVDALGCRALDGLRSSGGHG
jgi:hypothetical protein